MNLFMVIAFFKPFTYKLPTFEQPAPGGLDNEFFMCTPK